VVKLRNIILVTIDSLRPDWMDPDTPLSNAFPMLRKLWSEGITCQNGFSHGLFSQISFPSIFTSTLPLDYGGYDRGIRSRPVTLAEVCQKHGLRTAGFSSDHYLSRFYGYARGFDNFIELYDVGLFLRSIDELYLRYYAGLRSSGQSPDDSLEQRVASLLDRVFCSTLEFCELKESELGRFRLWSESVVDHYNFRQLAHLIGTELKQLRSDPRAYVARLFAELETRGIADIAKAANISITRPLLRSIWSTLKRVAPTIAQASAPATAMAGIGLRSFVPAFASANYIMRRARSLIRQATDGPFFIWIALNDPHELSFSKLMSPLKIRGMFRAMQQPLRGPELLYALSLKYTDAALGSLVQFLHAQDHLDSTLLVFCSDHGRVLQTPKQESFPAVRKPPARTFSEELIRVPMVFWNPHIEPMGVTHPCGLIDLAPTILDLMDWPSVPEFQGAPVYSSAAANRRTLLIDGMNGPCDFERQTPSICVLRDQHLYIWHGDEAIRVAGLRGQAGSSTSHGHDTSSSTALAEARDTAVSRCRSILSMSEDGELT